MKAMKGLLTRFMYITVLLLGFLVTAQSVYAMASPFEDITVQSNILKLVKLNLHDEEAAVNIVAPDLEFIPNLEDQRFQIRTNSSTDADLDVTLSIENVPQPLKANFVAGTMNEAFALEGRGMHESEVLVDASGVKSELEATGLAGFTFDIVARIGEEEVHRATVSMNVFDESNLQSEIPILELEEIDGSTIYFDDREERYSNMAFTFSDPKSKVKSVYAFVNGVEVRVPPADRFGRILIDENNQFRLNLYELCRFGNNSITFSVETTYGDPLFYTFDLTIASRGNLTLSGGPVYLGFGEYRSIDFVERIITSGLKLHSSYNDQTTDLDPSEIGRFGLPVELGEISQDNRMLLINNTGSSTMNIVYRELELTAPVVVDNVRSSTVVIHDDIGADSKTVYMKREKGESVEMVPYYFHGPSKSFYIKSLESGNEWLAENPILVYVKEGNDLKGYRITQMDSKLSEAEEIPMVEITTDASILEKGKFLVNIDNQTSYHSQSTITIPQGVHDIEILQTDVSSGSPVMRTYRMVRENLTDSIHIDDSFFGQFSKVEGEVAEGWQVSTLRPRVYYDHTNIADWYTYYTLDSTNELYVKKGQNVRIEFALKNTNDPNDRKYTHFVWLTPSMNITRDITKISTDHNLIVNLFKEKPDEILFTAKDKYDNELVDFGIFFVGRTLYMKLIDVSGESITKFFRFEPYKQVIDEFGYHVEQPAFLIEYPPQVASGTYNVSITGLTGADNPIPETEIDVTELQELYREAISIKHTEINAEEWEQLQQLISSIRYDASYLLTQEEVDELTDKLRSALEAIRAVPEVGKLLDLNEDNQVNISDVQSLYLHVMGIERLGHEALRMDYNGDGHVNISDVQALYLHVMGIEMITP